MSKTSWGAKACVILFLWATAAVAVSAQTFTTLHSFDGMDGDGPFAAVVQGADGSLYGTTYLGGVNNLGTVFSLTVDGNLTTLYSFCPSGNPSCLDGFPTYAGLIQGTDGNF